MVTQKEEKEKQKISRTETGKFFYDLSKATFSITVLGSIANIIKTNEIQSFTIWAAVSGIIASAMFFTIGYKILNR